MRPWKPVKSIYGIFDRVPNAFRIISSRFGFKRVTSSSIHQQPFTMPPVECRFFLSVSGVMLQKILLRPNTTISFQDVPCSASWNSDCCIWTFKYKDWVDNKFSTWRTEKGKLCIRCCDGIVILEKLLLRLPLLQPFPPMSFCSASENTPKQKLRKKEKKNLQLVWAKV